MIIIIYHRYRMLLPVYQVLYYVLSIHQLISLFVIQTEFIEYSPQPGPAIGSGDKMMSRTGTSSAPAGRIDKSGDRYELNNQMNKACARMRVRMDKLHWRPDSSGVWRKVLRETALQLRLGGWAREN